MPDSARARYWHRQADGRVCCDLCPRHCALSPGQRGLCFGRTADDDGIRLTTYGRSSGFCVDPIEKKPLYHFYPGSAVLSFGTAGCNLTCQFCQNWHLSHSRETDAIAETATPEQIAGAAARLGCRSVAFTYNDPVVFLEYAVDVAAACRALGVATVAVTAGQICATPRQEFFGQMDAANIDLKAFTDGFYRRLCGGALAPVLETLEYVHHETRVWLELTTLLIPGENDTDAEVHALSDWVATHLGPEVPLHFTAFHPAWRLQDRPPTPPDTLVRARAIGLSHGLRHVYTGNVADPEGASTWCHQCGCRLIARDRYALDTYELTNTGHCGRCGAACAGRFDGPAGSWGDRRLPVRLGSAA